MSQLVLVRHGQATPFEEDTDRLSPLGEAQARAVGEALRAEGVAPTHAWHGPLVRQRRTAELVADPSWPRALQDARLAEYDGDGLLRTLAPRLAARDPQVAALLRAFAAGGDLAERQRSLQRLLEAVAAAWQSGAVAHPAVEPWTAFRARVAEALADLTRSPSGSTVLGFTSGGVIGLVVALTLGAPDPAALALNWRVRNASVTRLTFGAGRLSLDSFNEVGHLRAPMRSWR